MLANSSEGNDKLFGTSARNARVDLGWNRDLAVSATHSQTCRIGGDRAEVDEKELPDPNRTCVCAKRKIGETMGKFKMRKGHSRDVLKTDTK